MFRTMKKTVFKAAVTGKLDGKPTKKGLYIVNGKKVVIK